MPLQGLASAGKKITPALPYGVQGFEISSDGKRVVFEAGHAISRMPELYSVPIDGPGANAVKLNIALKPDGFVFMSYVSADSRRVVYRINQEINVQYELYSVPIAGPASAGVKLNGALADGGDVKRVDISSDSARVVYTAEQQGRKMTELL